MHALKPGIDWFAAAGYPVTLLDTTEIYRLSDRWCMAPQFLPVQQAFLPISRDEAPPKSNIIRFSVGLSVVASLVLGGFLGVYMWPSPYKTHRVPNVIGLPIETATATLNHISDDVRTIAAQFNTTVPAGAVIATIPPAGRVIRSSRTVYVRVSLGAPEITVPLFSGKSKDQAAALAQSAGLALIYTEGVYSLTAPRDSILDQIPTAGETVTDASVVVTPSLGPPISITALDMISVAITPVLQVRITGQAPENEGPTTVSIGLEAETPFYEASHDPGSIVTTQTAVPIHPDGVLVWVRFDGQTVLQTVVQAPEAASE